MVQNKYTEGSLDILKKKGKKEREKRTKKMADMKPSTSVIFLFSSFFKAIKT
jgi:hypothetical protein